MVLQIRMRDLGVAADEGAGIKMRGSPQSGFQQEPSRADNHSCYWILRHVERDRLFAGVLNVEFEVVVEIAADTGQVMRYRNALSPHLVRRPDPRQQQELRRVDRAPRENDLARSGRAQRAAVLEFDRGRATTFHDDTARKRAG